MERTKRKKKLPDKDTYLNGTLKHQSVIFILAQLGVSVKIAGEKQNSTEGYADVDVLSAIVGHDRLIFQSECGGPGGIRLFRPRGRCRR